jgi:hypothetical protein
MTHDVDPNAMSDISGESRLSLHIGRLPIDVRVAVYSTIILMSGLALYDPGTVALDWTEWAKEFGAVLAPVAAVALAHAFAEALGHEVHTGTHLTPAVRKKIVLHNLQFLYPGIVTSFFLVPMLILHVPADVAVNTLLLVGSASLVCWGTFAGRRVGLGFWGTLTYALGYGVVGLLVVLVKYWLTH